MTGCVWGCVRCVCVCVWLNGCRAIRNTVIATEKLQCPSDGDVTLRVSVCECVNVCVSAVNN